MAAIIAATLPLTVAALTLSLADDPVARRDPLRLVSEARRLFGGPLFDGVVGALGAYLRPGFHPDDVDTTALLRRWQTELFGPDGTLVDHLK